VPPPDTSTQRLVNLCNRLGREKWNVHLCRRYAHGQGVMSYLARYVRGGPMRNTQLQIGAEQIRFRYRAHVETGHPSRTLALPVEAFLGRYLQHAPLPRRPVVRHYGLYATRATAPLNRARAAHAQLPVTPQREPLLSAHAHYERRAGGPTPATHCPHCGTRLILRAQLPRQQGPPC